MSEDNRLFNEIECKGYSTIQHQGIPALIAEMP
jgi:hypothetical protein